MENEDLTKERLVEDIISSPYNIIQINYDFIQLNFIDCQKLAGMDDSDGMYRLGYCYEYGIGVEKDENKAFIYYQKSADMDNSNGIYQVGYCYYLGIGVEIDRHKAFTYYLKSAEAGNVMGIFKTAICYRYGIGVEANSDKFWEWIIKDRSLLDLSCRFYRGLSDLLSGSGRLLSYIDLYSRLPEYGKCAHCNEDNTKEAWCLSCDPDVATQWTSKNKDIDDCMKAVQFKTLAYEDAIEWIPFDRLDNIIKIGEGGFGSIYKATWLDGIRRIEKIIKNDNFSYKRSREQDSIIALKTLPGFKTTQNSADFLSVFKNHVQCKLYCSRLQIYGLTYNLKSNEYLMAFQYADDGNIYKFLKSNFNKLTWEFKLKQLRDISKDLDQIHNAGYIHANFHSGNILHNRGISYVSDLGLSKKVGENNAEDIVFGVIPYVAPEVLSGKQHFTKRANIYSFGIIMVEISTGQRPFDGYKFDMNLAIEICNGLRPKFAPETPDCYIELAIHCMNTDPLKRPIASTVYCTIDDWIKKLALDDEHEIKKQFLNADKVIKTLPITPQSHPDHMYTSKIINTQKISSAFKDFSS